MKLYNKVKLTLETLPAEARERKNRSRLIWYLLKQSDPRIGQEELMTKQMFQDNFSLIGTFDRLIRKVQEENESLRGLDYDDKKRLEQEKELELGYEPGFHRNTKFLKKIAP